MYQIRKFEDQILPEYQYKYVTKYNYQSWSYISSLIHEPMELWVGLDDNTWEDGKVNEYVYDFQWLTAEKGADKWVTLASGSEFKW